MTKEKPMPTGYVVIEWNQAGGMPDLPDGAYLHHDLESAQGELDGHAARTAASGRRERYQLAEVHLIDDDEEV